MARTITALVAGAAFGSAATALPLVAAMDLPHRFSAGETASASEINENFEALVDRIDDIASRLNALEGTAADQAAVGDLDSRLTALENTAAEQTAVDALETRVTTLEDAEVQALNPYLRVFDTAAQIPNGAETTDANAPIVRVTGANLQIVNGLGVDGGGEPVPNGLGNLLVGYGRARGSAPGSPDIDVSGILSGGTADPICSDGRYDNQPDCLSGGGVWQTAHQSGSHNIVAGIGAAYSSTGGIVAGRQNAVTGPRAIALGGSINLATAEASVLGGDANQASAPQATISGGGVNVASGEEASVSGGRRNTASAFGTSVSGGSKNTASDTTASVSGGSENSASGRDSSVAGGVLNRATVSAAAVSGGSANQASGVNSVVSGGDAQVTSMTGEHVP